MYFMKYTIAVCIKSIPCIHRKELSLVTSKTNNNRSNDFNREDILF